MMMQIDWPVLAFGALAGLAAAALFFAGLAWGMRLALRTARPAAVLLPSAALRIGLLLAAGYWVAGQGAAALAGFAAGFLVLRVILLAAMRPPAARGQGGGGCN